MKVSRKTIYIFLLFMLLIPLLYSGDSKKKDDCSKRGKS